jgi:hypothetical protein
MRLIVEAAGGSKQVVIAVAVNARGCCYVPCPLADDAELLTAQFHDFSFVRTLSI